MPQSLSRTPQSPLCSSAAARLDLGFRPAVRRRRRREPSSPCRSSAAAMHGSKSVVASSSGTPGRQERSGYHLLPMKWGEKSGLPLVPCPKCGEEVLELVAGPGSKVPGAVFFACRFHDRDDPSSCPWFLFADKYKGMLIRRGLIEATAAETVIQQPEPELAAVGRDSDVPMLGAIGGLDAKLKKLVTIGQIGVVCTLVIAVFVVLGVIIMLVNRK